jgi:hypothetical protein
MLNRDLTVNQKNINIDVYAKDASLYVRLDILTSSPIPKSFAHLDATVTQYANTDLTQDDLRDNRNEIYNKKILQHIIQMSPKEPDNINSFAANAKNKIVSILGKNSFPFSLFTNKININHAVIIYKISPIPHVMINWLVFFYTLLNKHLYEKTYTNQYHIQFDNHIKFNNLGNIAIDELFSHSHTSRPIYKLIRSILKFNSDDLPNYKNALSDLNVLYINYSSINGSFIQYLTDINRFNIFYAAKINTHNEVKALETLIDTSDITNKIEFLFMLELNNSKSKLSFLNPCLGIKAHDNNPYCLEHTELLLFYFAEFYLYSDGTMAIINLDKNPAYLDFYAKGKENYTIFHDELKYLAPILDLEFLPGNFHDDKTIIFTPECSARLAKLNLHLNRYLTKDLFQAYITWTFFTRLYLNLTENNIFQTLPYEIMNKIIIKTNPSYERFHNHASHPGFFRATELGKMRGYKEHNEIIQRKLISNK